jgi:hypothetical protein
MRLPSVYAVVETISVCDLVGFPNRDPPEKRRGVSPERTHGGLAVRRGAPRWHAEPGNGGRTYRQMRPMSKEGTRRGGPEPPTRDRVRGGHVGSTPASGPAMSS